MAKVEFKGAKKITRILQKRFKSFIQNDEDMEKVAVIMRSELLKNLREGKGSDDAPLPSLKSSTISTRGSIAKNNKTHSKYSQSFSNVTLSGQFVRSLEVEAEKAIFSGERTFLFYYSGSHKGYKSGTGKRSKPVSNSLIYSELTDRGWKLTGVTAKAQTRIKKLFIRFLRRANKKR